MFAFALASLMCAVQTATSFWSPARPHCTLGDDLPLLVLLADPVPVRNERLVLPDGLERDVFAAGTDLWERHRRGHGGWPDESSTTTLHETRSVPCDSAALGLLFDLVLQDPFAADPILGVAQVADLLERNARFDDAELLLRAGSELDEDWHWPSTSCRLARFLMRRGRHAEAWPLLDTCEPDVRGCGNCEQGPQRHRWQWIERCFLGMNGIRCLDELFVLRWERVGLDGLAAYVADHLDDLGAADPSRESLEWFDRAFARDTGTGPGSDVRDWFASDLAQWVETRRHPSPVDGIDWSKEADVAVAVSRARKLLATDPGTAQWLLEKAAQTGQPVAGHAVLDLADDASIPWVAWQRDHLKAIWRNGVLARTYGCADPDDPRTW